MTKQLDDRQIEAIAGGGAFERLMAKLDRPGSLRELGWLRGGSGSAPGGPGPGPEAEAESDGSQGLIKK